MDIRCSSFAAGTTRVTRALPRAAATRTTFTSEPEGGGEGGDGRFSSPPTRGRIDSSSVSKNEAAAKTTFATQPEGYNIGGGGGFCPLLCVAKWVLY